MTKSNPVIIFTDGACRGNPGPGGWGAFMSFEQHEKKIYGGEMLTTNNRMELTAVIKSLEELKRPCCVKLTTDSQYVRNGILSWMPQWKRNNWHNSSKKPVKNVDLWQKLDSLTSNHQIEWLWVRGHTGNIGNETADILANLGVDELLKCAK